jgi:hypothetical protein
MGKYFNTKAELKKKKIQKKIVRLMSGNDIQILFAI